jgi:hypothetical protein
MQQPALPTWRPFLFPALVAGLAVVWIPLAVVCWLNGGTAARVLLALFAGAVLLAGLAWYGAASWAWRRGRAPAQSCRRPVGLFLFGWLLCLGSAVASGFSGGGADTTATPSPETPAATPPSKLFPKGPVRFLSDMEEFDIQPGAWPFAKNGFLNGDRIINVGGKRSPNGLSMHPPVAPAYASVKYRLGKEAARFKAVVAINDSTNWCWSPATFRVRGDGRELWASREIAHNHARSQECAVDVAGVDVLELRVQVANGNQGVEAVWVEPRLLQKAGAEEK